MIDDPGEEMKASVRAYGPCVLEYAECHACGNAEFAFHPFCESFVCDGCGGRIASKVSRYSDEELNA